MFESAISELQSTYDTVGPFYLTRFFQPGGEKTLYEFKRLTDILDTHRKQSLKKVLPEFKDLV